MVNVVDHEAGPQQQPMHQAPQPRAPSRKSSRKRKAGPSNAAAAAAPAAAPVAAVAAPIQRSPDAEVPFCMSLVPLLKLMPHEQRHAAKLSMLQALQHLVDEIGENVALPDAANAALPGL